MHDAVDSLRRMPVGRQTDPALRIFCRWQSNDREAWFESYPLCLKTTCFASKNEGIEVTLAAHQGAMSG